SCPRLRNPPRAPGRRIAPRSRASPRRRCRGSLGNGFAETTHAKPQPADGRCAVLGRMPWGRATAIEPGAPQMIRLDGEVNTARALVFAFVSAIASTPQFRDADGSW